VRFSVIVEITGVPLQPP
jgi:hypothetical protein